MRHKKSTLPFWKAKTRKTMNMGIGSLGRDVRCPECGTEFKDCTHIVFKRKFRWTVEADLPGGKIEPMFVKVNARPTPDIEETEINFLNGKTWLPKDGWQDMTISTWDLDAKEDFWKVIYPSLIAEGECSPENYGKFKVCLYDGCGCMLESWTLEDAYISNVNFSELDHSSSECVDIEMNIRYKKATYKSEMLSGQYLNGGMGLGSFGNYKVTCPNCKYEFAALPTSSIVY
jgi:hypothetical protein